MEKAYLLYDAKAGKMGKTILATHIRSRADAREKGPFVTETGELLVWVNWSKPQEKGNIPGFRKKRRAHFRGYPKSSGKRIPRKILNQELKERKKQSESPTHKKAKEILAEYLRELIKENNPIHWFFKDEEVSDFSLGGNLLSNVEEVETEYIYKVGDDITFKFDIALLGRKINKNRILLGVIEIEKNHEFGLLKCLICKSLGFPLVSISIKGKKVEDIDRMWATRAISETKNNSADGLRRNYIHIHSSLHSIYTKIPADLRRGDDKHQFVIFAVDDEFDDLVRYLEKYKKYLGFEGSNEIHISIRVAKSDQMKSEVKNAGSVVGKDWADYNENRYILLTMKFPTSRSGDLYSYHLIVMRLLNAHFNTLVGYKYRTQLKNYDLDNEIWVDRSLLGEFKVTRKQISRPLKPIIEFLREEEKLDKIVEVAN